MFPYISYRNDDSEYLSLDDHKFEFTNVVLELTNKDDHDRLLRYQRFLSYHVAHPINQKLYNIKFDLDLSDTGLPVGGGDFYYQDNLDNLENKKIYLFVCSVHTCKHNIIPDNAVTLYEANASNISWHFLCTNSKVDVVTKHKGIVQKLNNKDLLVFAGEMYIDKDKVVYNLQTGCLKEFIFKNNENIVYHEEKETVKTSCKRYNQIIAKPLIQKLAGTKEINFDDNLRKKYGEEITYDYLLSVIKQYPQLNYTIKRVKKQIFDEN